MKMRFLGRKEFNNSHVAPTILFAVFCASISPVSAQQGDLSAGRLLASNCFTCHGTDGKSNGGFDSLAGESVSEIISEMREFKVEDDGIMSVHARGFTEDQVRLIAEYLASR